MKNILLKIPFDSDKQQLSEAKKKLAYEIHKKFLGRPPIKKDTPRFEQRTNLENSSISDQYVDGKKIGHISTVYILEGHREIWLDFTPER
jgi:hypothetical protein